MQTVEAGDELDATNQLWHRQSCLCSDRQAPTRITNHPLANHSFSNRHLAIRKRRNSLKIKHGCHV
jgi:hypothetical protein